MGFLGVHSGTAMVVFASFGCLGDVPQQRDPAVQGDFEDGDEEHRPGQPCLLCHGDDGFLLRPPGEKVLELAGTVYNFIDANANDGIAEVEVTVWDADGHQATAITNRAGNFMFEVKSGLSAPKVENKGKTKVPWEFEFPLEVAIRRGSDEQAMTTRIWRDGSCAGCHKAAPGADSVGRIYLFEGPTP